MGDPVEEALRRILGGAVTQSAPRLRVPGNLVDVIRAVEGQTGVPFEIIAGVIQTNGTTGTSGDWPVGVTPDLIAQVANTLSEARPSPYSDWRVTARSVFGASRPSWLERFDSIVYARDDKGNPDTSRPEWLEREPSVLSPDATKITIPYLGAGIGGQTIDLRGPQKNLTRSDFAEALRKGLMSPAQYQQALIDSGFSEEEAALVALLDAPSGGAAGVDVEDVRDYAQRFLGRDMNDEEAGRYVGMSAAALRAALISQPEAAEWRKNGEAVQRAHGWADGIWQTFYGTTPTNAEVLEIVKRGHTPDSLRRYLADQPYGGTTLGTLKAAREIADKYAFEYVGRKADEGEINWLITNKVTTPEAVSAYYEQLKTRIDSGDPTFAWAADPATWRASQSQLQSIWQQAGMLGKIDPNVVNQAVTEKWDAQRAQQYVDALPAPGLTGITVGEASRVRAIAQKWKDIYLPGDPLTREELSLFVNKNSEDMRRYYRSLPADMTAYPGTPMSKPEEQKSQTTKPDKPAPPPEKPAPPTRTPIRTDRGLIDPGDERTDAVMVR